MAIANLHELLVSYKLRQSALNLEIAKLQDQRTLAVAKQGDATSIKAQDEQEVRNYFKALYEGDEEYKSKYSDYTKITEFDEAMDKIAAKYNDEMEELNSWETSLMTQITTDSAELEEVKAYYDSMKSNLSSNIQNDFKYGSNG